MWGQIWGPTLDPTWNFGIEKDILPGWPMLISFDHN